jgi:hypothetical protein
MKEVTERAASGQLFTTDEQ